MIEWLAMSSPGESRSGHLDGKLPPRWHRRSKKGVKREMSNFPVHRSAMAVVTEAVRDGICANLIAQSEALKDSQSREPCLRVLAIYCGMPNCVQASITVKIISEKPDRFVGAVRPV